MEAEQPAAIVQSAAEQAGFDEVPLISFGCMKENCVCGAGHMLPQG